jgi:hypothetical protein
MNFANYMSVLKGWVGYAAAGIVRLKALAPYALIELILPGGSVMALLLWLYRRKKSGVGFAPLAGRLLSVLRLAHFLHFEALAPSAPMTSTCKQG